MKKLIFIVGPTAIGKTSLSIKVALHFACDIISCDSRQFFKEMNIGTAVPSNEELGSVVHHFIQNKSIHENYTVGDFERDAISKINHLFQTNDYLVVVGGSGLYVDALLNGLDIFPDIDKEIRHRLINDLDQKGIEFLQQQLKLLDNFYFQKLTDENAQTLQNPQRMLRFLEVCISSGKPYSSFLKKQETIRNFTPIIIGLEADRKIIYNRIEQRVDLMMENGLLEEVKSLQNFQHLNALQTVGYKELFHYLNNFCRLEFAISEIKKNTRRYAKRQLTWFRRYENISWFDFETDFVKIIKVINHKKQ